MTTVTLHDWHGLLYAFRFQTCMLQYSRRANYNLQEDEAPCTETVVASFSVFERLAKAGIAVHSYDCHGHGRSEPHEERSRALIWRFHHVVGLQPPSVMHIYCLVNAPLHCL